MASPMPFTPDSLRNLGVFSGLPEASLNWLLQVGSVSHLPARRTLSSLQDSTTERYCFVLDGALAITHRGKGVSSSAANPQAPAADSDVEYIGHLERGACFSDGFLAVRDGSPSSRIDCVATHSTTLLQIEMAHLATLTAQHDAWRATLVQRFLAQRDHFIAHRAPSRRIVQDFFLRQNYSTSTVVRVTRRDQCMSCNKCFEACGARHGVPRMIRVGASLGRLTFPIVCRSCHEKPCLAACRLGALVSDGTAGELRILDSCTGCGLCAKACPNRAISIVERSNPGELSPVQLSLPGDATGAREAGGENAQPAAAKRRRRRAVKCDNCADYPDRACLTACPTGALVELLPDKLFLEEVAEPSTRIRRFSAGAFLTGVAPRQGSPRVSRIAITTLLLLALLGTGVEAFLRATQPETSLTAHFARWAHLDWGVSYSSGRGFGHWLGYLGTSAMLLSVLYSLRTRIKRFSHLGRQSAWLSAHLWLGFIGGVLVTYHSALKLDRWASIACILIWIILLTGALGRYLYGGLHAGIGLAEFDLRSLRARLERWAPPEGRSAALRTLLGAMAQEGQKPPLFVVVLWHEVRDRALLLGLRLRGASHLIAPDEHREFLKCVAQWSAIRRRASYCYRAETMLRHWNIVHIVLAIVMAVLAAVHIVYGFVYKVV